MEYEAIGVDGVRIRWKEQGQGPAVIFLHGIPTSPALWRLVIPQVRSARCLAWEMVGYGSSIKQGWEGDISVAQQADYLIAWMDALHLDHAVLVGHDLGGGVAQIAAVRHPGRVRGLVLINSICYDSWPIPSVKVMRALSPLVALLPNALFYLIFSLMLYRGHDDVECAQESIRAHWPHYASTDGAAAFARQVRALDVHDTLAVAGGLPHLRLPARLVWGDADLFQKIHYGERLARDLDAPLDRIEGGKHFVPEDHSDRVAEAVNTLLEALATKDSR